MKHVLSFMPDKRGFFGSYGGRFVPPVLEKPLRQLANAYESMRRDTGFLTELHTFYQSYAGRPSALYFAKRLTDFAGGAKIYLKREDLNHTGAHKINNCIGQALIAKRMGKRKLIAETGAGQHGTATAAVAAYFNMKCDVYMGSRDIKAQKPNVYRMKILGARVIEVKTGEGALKDAVDAALEGYVQEPDAHYLLGSAVGPHPYPMMVRDFQKVIGQETKDQILACEGKLPHSVIACVGGGSNAIGMFHEFIPDHTVRLVAVEPAGLGEKTHRHGLSLAQGKTTIIHGFKTLTLQTQAGEIALSYSAASGLDYPGVGPELSYLKDTHRLTCASATDKQAVEAFTILSRTEGIIPALESAHAVSYALSYAKKLKKEDVIVVNLSGRGDKDVENVYKTYI